MENENNPLDTLARDFEFESGDGAGDVGNSSETLTLSEINALTGRNYKDKDTALKAVKETYSMVGKAGKIEKEYKLMSEQLQEKESALGEIKQIKEQLFYSENPQYKPYKETISAMGGNPSEVVEKEAFKKIFADLSEFEKTKNAKSVLESNPRIGQARTKLDEARDMANKGQYSSANEAAVSAVLAAYE